MPTKKSTPQRNRTSKPSSAKKLSQKELFARRMKHADLLQPLQAEVTGHHVLGHAAAVVIVCGCANTSPLNLPRTLTELGVNGTSFQTCVFNAVQNAGFQIKMD